MQMKMTATEFKAKCLEVLDTVNRTGEIVTITKRGMIVAELRPPNYDPIRRSGRGIGTGELLVLGDIVSPLDLEWDSLK